MTFPKRKFCPQQNIRWAQFYHNGRQTHKETAKKFDCKSCGKTFCSWKKLQEHQTNIHTVEKAKRFLRRRYLLLRVKLILKKIGKVCQWQTVSWKGGKCSGGDTVEENVKLNYDKTFERTSKAGPVKSQHAVHLKRKAEGFYCVCGKQSPSKDSLMNHIRYFAHKCQFQCSHCQERFSGFVFLRSHMWRKHGLECPGDVGCLSGGNILNSLKDLRQHQIAKGCQNQAIPPTSERKKASSFYVMTKQHAVDRFKRYGFYCQCGSRHRSLFNLQDHITYFTSQRKFVCHVCSKRFVYLSQVEMHMVGYHKTNKAKYNQTCGCSECGEYFASVKKLRQHKLDIHSSTGPVKQPASQQPSESALSTGTTDALAYLKPIFSSVAISSPYSISFVYPTSKDHGLDCSNEHKKLSCKCGMRFGNKGSLDAHVQFFGLDRTFPCLYCGQLFSGLRGRNAHVREAHHTDPDPDHVGCPSCGVIFANKQEYRRHMIMKTDYQHKFLSRCCPIMLVRK